MQRERPTEGSGALQRTAHWGHSQGHGTKVFFLFQAQCVTPGRLGKTQECSSGVSLIFFQAPQERQEQHKTHSKAERPQVGRGNWQLMQWAALRKDFTKQESRVCHQCQHSGTKAVLGCAHQDWAAQMLLHPGFCSAHLHPVQSMSH